MVHGARLIGLGHVWMRHSVLHQQLHSVGPGSHPGCGGKAAGGWLRGLHAGPPAVIVDGLALVQFQAGDQAVLPGTCLPAGLCLLCAAKRFRRQVVDPQPAAQGVANAT